jgi:hypothetical protein
MLKFISTFLNVVGIVTLIPIILIAIPSVILIIISENIFLEDNTNDEHE